MSKHHRMTALLLILFTLLVACSNPEATSVTDDPIAPESVPEQLTEVKVCMSRSVMLVIPTYAQEQGLFQKYGLDAELIIVDGGATTATALIANDCGVGYVGGSPVANAVVAGHEVVIVAGLLNRQLLALVASPEISDVQDLRGQTMVTGRPGGAADTFTQNILRMFDLDQNGDVTILPVEGGDINRLAALEAGQASAAVMAIPEVLRATNIGYRILLGPSDLDQPYQLTVISATREQLQNNRPVVKAFLQAIIEAGMMAQQDREGAIAAMASVLGYDQTTDAAILDEAYNQLILEYLEDIPYPSHAGVQALLDEVALENEAARDIDPGSMIDDSLIRELEDDGFIASIQEE